MDMKKVDIWTAVAFFAFLAGGPVGIAIDRRFALGFVNINWMYTLMGFVVCVVGWIGLQYYVNEYMKLENAT